MIFLLRQNNSGGRFDEPAVFVFIEADDHKQANELAEKHISLCGDSGMYGEFDNCGCCPCCGHRWERMDDWNKVKPDDLSYYKSDDLPCSDGMQYMGFRQYALIERDGSLMHVDSAQDLTNLWEYLDKISG